MNVSYSKNFLKQFDKLPPKKQQQARNAISTLLDNPNAVKIRRHALRGEWQGFHSISAGGDLRLHYKHINEKHIIFDAVGSHSQLYK